MKMYIHSAFGVLECEPMTLQSIEKSIPEAIDEETNQVSEVVEHDAPESCSNGLGSSESETPNPEN